MNEQRTRIVEHNRLESLKAWKLMNENSRIINNNVGDGGTGSGGSFEPDPGPAATAGAAYTELYPDGTYKIWIVNTVSATETFVDTGFPYTVSSSFDIVPTQDKGFMYVLQSGIEESTYRLIYYKIDGTLIFDKTYEGVNSMTWDVVGGKGTYAFISIGSDRFFVYCFEDNVIERQITDCVSTNPGIYGFTPDGRIFISYGETDGDQVIKMYDQTGAVYSVANENDQPQFIAYYAYPSADYYGQDNEVIGSRQLVLTYDRNGFELVDETGANIIDLRAQILDQYGYDIATSTSVDYEHFGSALINPTDISNMRWRFTFYDSYGTKHIFLIKADTGVYFYADIDNSVGYIQDYNNNLSNSYAFYVQNASGADTIWPFQSTADSGFPLCFIDSNGNSSFEVLPTRLGGSGWGILMEDNGVEYILWPYITRDTYEYRLHTQLADDAGYTTFNAQTSDESTTFEVMTSISKNGYKKVVFAFNKAGVSQLWHVVNPNNSLEMVATAEVPIGSGYMPYKNSFQPPFSSGGPFVVPFADYGTGNEVQLAIFDINNTSDPENYLIETSTDLITPSDSLFINNYSYTGTRSNVSNNGSFIFLNYGISSGQTYNFCFIDNSLNVTRSQFYSQTYNTYSIGIFPDVLYTGISEDKTIAASTSNYNILKEINTWLPNNDTNINYTEDGNGSILKIFTKDGNYYTFNKPLGGPIPYQINQVNDTTWYND